MLDEFESSARLLPPGDEKAADRSLADRSSNDEKIVPAEQAKAVEPLHETAPQPEKVIADHPAKPVVSRPEKAAVSHDDKVQRPFRVKLRGSVLVLMRLPNKRSVRGAFHQLSTTGGVIHLEKPLDEKVEVELIFHIQEKTIRNKAQMLFPMWATQGWMQPFRFVDLADESRAILDASLKTFLGDLSKGNAAGA